MNIKSETIRAEYTSRLMSADDAVRLVQSGDRVYIGTSSSVAYILDAALAKRQDELSDLTILAANLMRPSKLIDCGKYETMTYFMGFQERKGVATGTTNYTSFHLSQLDLWSERVAKPDVVMLEVSPPDEDGYMSYGATGVVVHHYLKEVAKTVILQVNRNAPYVYGEYNKIHCTEADAIVEADDELGTLGEPEVSDEIRRLCSYIIEEIPDGATIQLGAGRVATALGYLLTRKNDLGIHTEVIGDSLMNLMKSGNVNNSRKTYYPGKSVIGFAYGTKELYEFLNRNPNTHFLPLPIMNDPVNIAKNDNMISVNNALSVDLTGQVVSESMGFRQHSGVGGQVDYVRGAQMSKGGKSFIALESTFCSKKTGEVGSRIVSTLAPGSVVTTPRCDVHYLATEYGCVNLKELTMRDRVRAIISLAHPDHRAQLTDEAKRYRLL